MIDGIGRNSEEDVQVDGTQDAAEQWRPAQASGDEGRAGQQEDAQNGNAAILYQ